MKNYFLIILMLSGATACSLDEYNPSGITADAIWSSPEGFATVVNSAYSEQRAWYGKDNGEWMGEMGTDLWFNAQRANYANELMRYENFIPSKGNPNIATWKNMYTAINICNAGINRIDNAGFTDTVMRNQRLGELRYLRAFYYYHVVEQWGGVILSTTETNDAIVTATRSDVKDFYKLILSDLEYAAKHLPLSYGAEYSRATQKSALAMLARANLACAYYYTGGEQQEYFKKAKAAVDEIIARKSEFGVALWDNYGDVFNPKNNKQNKEALYTISNSLTYTLDYDQNANRLHMWFLTTYSSKPGLQQSMDYGRDGTRYFMPTRALLDFFDDEKDSRFDGSFQTVWICNKAYTWTEADVKNYGKDPSLVGHTMVVGVDTAMYITRHSVPDKSTRPYLVIDRDSVYNTNGTIRVGNDYVPLKKFMDPITRSAANAQPGFLDILVIRLAEMYLIGAEAALQLGDNSAAAAYINVLRTRAAKKTPVDYTAAMQISASDVTLDFILDERARELAGEHVRWFDLKRTGKLVERIHTYNPDVTQVQEYHRLRPVPQTQIDALTNGAEFGQNPGY
ncbi:RagB/SusD family nutrient uptake outer membrane protein [Chitinophaga sp.]|uniref:RagB/SusD family nutrient uptake outer membrane protein n=1 Tax=Chitinophaga sp. TaxID=1869181 RepID=UPI0031E02CD1